MQSTRRLSFQFSRENFCKITVPFIKDIRSFSTNFPTELYFLRLWFSNFITKIQCDYCLKTNNSWISELTKNVAWNSSDCFESFSPLNNWGSIFVSVLAIVRLNWIRGAVRTSATIEWNMQKKKPVSKIWNTSSETSYFTGADTLKPYKSCDAVWCTQHLKSCDVYITVLSIPNSATSLNYMILLYKTIIFNWNFPWRV